MVASSASQSTQISRRPLRLTLKNLGRIAAAEIELRPLTLFVGRNNANKSWTAYAAWSLLAYLLGTPEQRSFVQVQIEGLPGLEESARRLEADLLRSLAVRGPIESVLRVERQAVIEGAGGKAVLKTDAKAIANLLGVSTKVLPSAEASVQVDLERPDVAYPSALVVRVTRDAARHVVGIVEFEGSAQKIIIQQVQAGQARSWLVPALERLAFGVARTSAPFPVDRIITRAPGARRRLHFGVPPPPPPIVGAFDALVASAVAASTSGQSAGDEAIMGILHEALGGRLSVQNQGVFYKIDEGPELGLSAAASLVRSLGALSLYVEHLAQPGDWIVIDEPEMNAHPSAQLHITELLAVLTRRGHNVIATTQTPYVLEHLNHLLAAGRLSAAAQEALALGSPPGALREARAFLRSDDLSVYEFSVTGSGQVEVLDKLDRSAAFIDTSTFGQVSDRLGDDFNRILDREQAHE